MDLTEYRNSQSEQNRVGDLISLLPTGGKSVLDIGARDGYISRLLAAHYLKVTALDLEQPVISHERIECVKGDITKLGSSLNPL
jgi:2-polyprenyl-3-methyl-5-hydroxy-6-metoxy-1,4-benzoquinol methylase